MANDDEEVTDPILNQVWSEHVRWKHDAIASGEYDNSVCTARTPEDWPKCEHCRNEVRRINIEAGRRDDGQEWQQAPFLLDA